MVGDIVIHTYLFSIFPIMVCVCVCVCVRVAKKGEQKELIGFHSSKTQINKRTFHTPVDKFYYYLLEF